MDASQFLKENAVEPDQSETFELATSKMLGVEVDGTVIAKAGTMVAAEGDVEFTGKLSAGGGLKSTLLGFLSNESTPVMEVTGNGRVFLGDQGKNVQILRLGEGQGITVNGNDVLAFENSVEYEISTMDGLSGMSSGGLLNVFLRGPGFIAITTRGDPRVLQPPVRTDPSALVAWSENLSPSSHLDLGLSDMIGQSSGETYQLEFEGGDGFVVVQPVEERNPNQGQ